MPGILTAICALIDGNAKSDEDEIRSILLGTYREIIEPVEAMKKIVGFLE